MLILFQATVDRYPLRLLYSYFYLAHPRAPPPYFSNSKTFLYSHLPTTIMNTRSFIFALCALAAAGSRDIATYDSAIGAI